MERITADHLMDIQFIGNALLSPDGAHTAYVVTKQNYKKNRYDSTIHLMNNLTGETKQMTFSGKESAFAWADENTLLFAAKRGKEDKPEAFSEKTAFYTLSLSGGEAQKAFDIAQNVSAIKPLGDGKYLAHAIVNLNAPGKEMDETLRQDEKDYHVLEEIPFWSNGRGYISRIRNTLFLYDARQNTLERITPPFFNVTEYDAKDGRVLYAGCEYEDKLSIKGQVKCYDIATGTTEDLIEKDTYGVEGVMLTDSGAILMLNTHEPYGLCQASSLYRYDRETGSLTPAYDGDVCVGSQLMSDCAYGSGEKKKVIGDDLFFIGQVKADAQIYRLRADNTLEVAAPFTGNVICMDTDGEELIFIGQPPNRCCDLYRLEGGAAVQKTDLNGAFFKDKYVAEAKYIPFTNTDGIQIDGWILEPFDYDPAKKYPGVLEIHGGPRCTYGTMFFHEMQQMAGDGYFVFFCNPRGGEGYGEDFADLRGKYGTIDYRDLMEFTDHVLSLYPQIDEKRIGAAGGSYGGFMCNWIVGHTGRFAAIASQRSISNWVADFGASEIGFTFDMNDLGANPWTDMQKMWDQSPLKYACNAKTPILFIHSLGDYNCTIDQGVEMFTAMKFFGVPSRMCVFEGENHNLSRTGKPRHRLRRLSEIMSWFDRYMKAEG